MSLIPAVLRQWVTGGAKYNQLRDHAEDEEEALVIETVPVELTKKGEFDEVTRTLYLQLVATHMVRMGPPPQQLSLGEEVGGDGVWKTDMVTVFRALSRGCEEDYANTGVAMYHFVRIYGRSMEMLLAGEASSPLRSLIVTARDSALSQKVDNLIQASGLVTMATDPEHVYQCFSLVLVPLHVNRYLGVSPEVQLEILPMWALALLSVDQ